MPVLIVVVGLALVLAALFWAWPLVVGLAIVAGLATKVEPNDRSVWTVFAPLAAVTTVIAIGATFWWFPIARDITDEPEPADSETDRDYVPRDHDYGNSGGGDPTDFGDVSDSCVAASQSSNMTVEECMEAWGF